jgi:hypothetical protein
MNPNALLTLNDRFVWILEAIYAATAARYRSVGWTIPMIWAVCNRIRRIERRVVKLLELFQAGMLPAEVAPARRSRAGEKRVAKADAVKLPRYAAWLVVMVPCTVANLACNLRMVLAEPEMMALLAASPKARRAMLTLGHMLGIERSMIAPEAVVPQAAAPDVVTVVEVAPEDAAVEQADGGLPGPWPPDGRGLPEGPPGQAPPLI